MDFTLKILFDPHGLYGFSAANPHRLSRAVRENCDVTLISVFGCTNGLLYIYFPGKKWIMKICSPEKGHVSRGLDQSDNVIVSPILIQWNNNMCFVSSIQMYSYLKRMYNRIIITNYRQNSDKKIVRCLFQNQSWYHPSTNIVRRTKTLGADMG